MAATSNPKEYVTGNVILKYENETLDVNGTYTFDPGITLKTQNNLTTCCEEVSLEKRNPTHSFTIWVKEGSKFHRKMQLINANGCTTEDISGLFTIEHPTYKQTAMFIIELQPVTISDCGNVEYPFTLRYSCEPCSNLLNKTDGEQTNNESNENNQLVQKDLII